MLEARRNIPGGETTDDGGIEDDTPRKSRNRKYTRSKTDTTVEQMKQLVQK